MRIRMTRRRRLLASLALSATIAAGCADDDPTEEADPAGTDVSAAGDGASDPGPSDTGDAEPTTDLPAATPPPRVDDPEGIEIAAGRVAGAGATVDLYRPTGGTDGPVVVIFGDSRVAAAGYGPLAARLAEQGAAVGVADRVAPEVAPAATSCVLETAARWGRPDEDPDAAPAPVVVIGFGDGAVPAVGESFDGIWTDWSDEPRCTFEEATTPVILVVVAAQLGRFPAGSFAESLDPFDQPGLNPYLQVKTVAGVDVAEVEDGLLLSFHEFLLDGGYDAELVEPDLETNTLFGGGGADGLDADAVEALADVVLSTFAFAK